MRFQRSRKRRRAGGSLDDLNANEDNIRSHDMTGIASCTWPRMVCSMRNALSSLGVVLSLVGNKTNDGFCARTRSLIEIRSGGDAWPARTGLGKREARRRCDWMTRAFMYAGAPQSASVSGRRRQIHCDLMTDFYKRLLRVHLHRGLDARRPGAI